MLECLNKYQCIAKVKPKYHRLGWGGLHIATIATEALNEGPSSEKRRPGSWGLTSS